MTLDGLMFENLIFPPFLDRIMRALASVRPSIFDVVIMSVVVKGDLLELICRGRTNNLMVLCQLHQDWFKLFVIYNTHMTHINVMDKLQE